MERNLIRERTKSAMAIKKANGQRLGTVPFAFELAQDGSALVPCGPEQAVRARIRAMRGGRRTWAKIAERLSDDGVPTKTGKSDSWTHQAVGRILNRI